MTINLVSLVVFTIEMAFAGVLLTLPFGIPLSYWLARTKCRGKSLIETIATVPLVLPPTVIGLFLLELFSLNRLLGRFLFENFGLTIVFTWRAVIFTGAVVSFPLLVRTVRTSFEQIDPRLEDMARTLGKTPLNVFFTVSIPLAIRGIVAGSILAFARALGEFGATILVAGNIPGETQTLSLAIFQLVQLGRAPEAYRLAAVTVVIALLAIAITDRLSRRPPSHEKLL